MEDGAHHLVPLDQSIPGLLQLWDVDVLAFELPVPVRPNPAEREYVLPSKPIGALNLGWRKRVEAAIRVGRQIRRSPHSKRVGQGEWGAKILQGGRGEQAPKVRSLNA